MECFLNMRWLLSPSFFSSKCLLPHCALTLLYYLLVAKFTRPLENVMQCWYYFSALTALTFWFTWKNPHSCSKFNLSVLSLLKSPLAPWDKLVSSSFVPTLYLRHRSNLKTSNTLLHLGRQHRIGLRTWILESEGLYHNLGYSALWPLAIYLTS